MNVTRLDSNLLAKLMREARDRHKMAASPAKRPKLVASSASSSSSSFSSSKSTATNKIDNNNRRLVGLFGNRITDDLFESSDKEEKDNIKTSKSTTSKTNFSNSANQKVQFYRKNYLSICFHF